MKKTFATFLTQSVMAFVAVFALLLTLTTGCGPAKPILYFYTWEDYIDPAVVADFEKEFNCQVIIETFESNEDMVAKIRTGSVHYDVILPTTYTVEIMRNEGLIQKLNPALIPNVIQNVDPIVAEKNGDVKFEYSVPYYEGITGLGCLVSECDPIPDSWTVFAGENEKYQKRIALLDDMRETIGAALMTLGYDINTTDDAQLEEAKNVVIAWRKNIAKFGVDDIKQDLNSGANYIIHGYGGDIMQMTAEDDNIRFVIPKEGAIVNFDNFVVPTDATNPELAQKFINFMCAPENAGRNMEFTKYGVGVKGAMEYVSEATRTIPGFVVTDEVMAKTHVIKNLDEEGIKKFTQTWDEIKSAD
ncbi:MAG: spermidine/putrescine ABC transporter substrate-binding protein [Planctomycetia bacterium]|nr:spermidine/putrescine ABC transporter substrate-binding protein [Planctomycetia bacterium]